MDEGNSGNEKSRGEASPTSETPLPDDLHRWVRAELLSLEQARRIVAFEVERTRDERSGRASRAVALLGALTLVSGFGSLVAYNWDRLGDALKLGGLGVFLTLSLAAVGYFKLGRDASAAVDSDPSAEGRGNTGLDVALLLSSGLTLAGLSLVSQIYHQDGELWQLLFAWSLATAPLMSFARTRFAHVFWYVGLFASLMSSFEQAADFLRDALSWDSDHAAWVGVLTFGTLSVVLAQRFASSRYGGRAWVGRLFVHLLLVSLGLFGGLFWFHGEDAMPVFWVLGGLATGAIFVSAPASLDRLGFGPTRNVQILFGVGLGLAVLPMGLPVESGFLAFIAFLLFWASAWYFAERSGSEKRARLAVFFIGSRVVIASFELFESLLVTGGVLIGLGALALLWSRHSLGRVGEKEVARG